ncbi:MAG: hypothetical protein AB1716_05620 [Planctomycetota bacterium]
MSTIPYIHVAKPAPRPLRNVDRAQPGELSHRQKCSALALALSGSLSDAARRSNVSERTLRRWQSDLLFIREVSRRREEVLSTALTRFTAALSGAADTLTELHENPDTPAAVRCSAARAIAELALRGAEVIDYARRLQDLEAAVDAAESGEQGGAD